MKQQSNLDNLEEIALVLCRLNHCLNIFSAGKRRQL
jgi:hypothetical protein